jgi:hypothetical protein
MRRVKSPKVLGEAQGIRQAKLPSWVVEYLCGLHTCADYIGPRGDVSILPMAQAVTAVLWGEALTWITINGYMPMCELIQKEPS